MRSFKPRLFWDDELESLSIEVNAVFGEQAVEDAVTRAEDHCRRESALDAAVSLDFGPRLAAAIKSEFRRRLTKH